MDISTFLFLFQNTKHLPDTRLHQCIRIDTFQCLISVLGRMVSLLAGPFAGNHTDN